MMRPCKPVSRYTSIRVIDLYCNKDGLEDPLDGCEDLISKWSHTGGGIY
jgi:hypothetical protein